MTAALWVFVFAVIARRNVHLTIWSTALAIALATAVEPVSVLTHEMVHVLMNRRFGLRTHRILLRPRGGSTYHSPAAKQLPPSFWLIPWLFTVSLAATGLALAVAAGAASAHGLEVVALWMAGWNGIMAVSSFKDATPRPGSVPGDALRALRAWRSARAHADSPAG